MYTVHRLRSDTSGEIKKGKNPNRAKAEEEESEYKPEGVVCSQARLCLWRVEPGRTVASQPGQLLQHSQHTIANSKIYIYKFKVT